MIRGLKILLLLMPGWYGSLYGQADSKQAAMDALKKLADRYAQGAYLSFDLTYRYAAENKPAVVLDSLSGHCKMNGGLYWYDLDNTESIHTNEYTILLFKEDKVMYLASTGAPDRLSPPIGGIKVGGEVDSMMLNNKNISCTISDNGSEQVITVLFAGTPVCRKMDYYINKQTGFLSRMVSEVRAEQLYDASVRPQVANDGTYAIVEAVYSNYRANSFDDRLFDAARYFKKEGKEYVTVAPYTEYKVFLGSSKF